MSRKWQLVDEVGNFLDRLCLTNDKFLHFGQAQSLDIGIPVDALDVLLQFSKSHLVVVSLRVAEFNSTL